MIGEPVFGAVPTDAGVRFRVWAPEARSLELLLDHGPDALNRHALHRGEHGLWEIALPHVRPGDRYAYSIDEGDPRPDPASRYQPGGVHGWSEVVDPSTFRWTDAGWRGVDPHRAVIYELHVGTFTPEGTFQAAIAKLPHLKALGVTAIELMPLADFAGRRNWGYDGVALFAPSRAYGRPDDLRSLVDAAHAAGVAVLVDVVYNHLGPEGAYLPSFSRQFLTPTHQTPWGDAVNLDARGSDVVRRLIADNALHWIHEYHADGLRLDATHALIDASDRPFVAELVEAVHAAADPPPLIYAEDCRNLAMLVEEPSRGGWGLDGVWADDFHHIVRRMLAGDEHSYYVDYTGDASELAETLRHGWLYTGQMSRHHQAPRGTSAAAVEMRKSVVCIQNHDQVGNRALGDRLHHGVDPAAWRAAVAVLLTAPMTPLLFMGQEWAASTPFQFFTDFEPGLGRSVGEGRRQEFQAFPEFASPSAADRIPDPQADATFITSRLDWEELHAPVHTAALNLHRALLQLRRDCCALHGSDARECHARALDDDTVVFRREASNEPAFVVVARLRGAGRVIVDELANGAWRQILDTEDARFAPDGQQPRVERAAIEFARPGALVFQRTSEGAGGAGGAKPPGY